MLLATYPEGLKPGDFIQPANCFSDIYFEVLTCFGPIDGRHWHITYATYGKYGSKPYSERINSATNIRSVLPAEMAVPVLRDMTSA